MFTKFSSAEFSRILMKVNEGEGISRSNYVKRKSNEIFRKYAELVLFRREINDWQKVAGDSESFMH